MKLHEISLWLRIVIFGAVAVLVALLFAAVATAVFHSHRPDPVLTSEIAGLRKRVVDLETMANATVRAFDAQASVGSAQTNLDESTYRLLESHQNRIDKLTDAVEMQGLDLLIISNRFAAAIIRLSTPTAARR